MSNSLSIIVATVGRPTLAATLQSISAQPPGPDDEVILIHDGTANEVTRAVWEHSQLRGRLIELADGPHGDCGHIARNIGMTHAGKDHVLYMDDDDCYTSGAFEIVKHHISQSPEALHLFQMRFPDGRVVWCQPRLSLGNVGTPMIVHPNGIPIGKWGPARLGDFHFIEQTVRLNAERPLNWIPQVIARIRPHTPQPLVPEPGFTHDWSQWFRENMSYHASAFRMETCRYLEIGILEGQSLCWMLDHVLTEPGDFAIGVDYWPSHTHLGDLTATRSRALAHLGRYDQNRWSLIESPSTAAFLSGRIPPASQDIVYVDGAHDYRGCLSDLILSWAALREGGLLVVDDFYSAAPQHSGVGIAVREFAQRLLSPADFEVLFENYQIGLVKNKVTNHGLDV